MKYISSRIALVFVLIVTFLGVLTQTSAVFAKPTPPEVPEEVNCPNNWDTTCNVFSKELWDWLDYLAEQGWVNPQYDYTFAKHPNWIGWRRVIVATHYKEHTDLVNRVNLTAGDMVGIPEMGIQYQRDQLVVWEPTPANPNERERPVWVTQNVGPTTYRIENLVGRDMRSYWWKDPQTLVIYGWDIEDPINNPNQVVINIDWVSIQRVQDEVWDEQVYAPLSVPLVLPNELNLTRGEQVEVTDIQYSNVYWKSNNSNWEVAYNSVESLVFQTDLGVAAVAWDWIFLDSCEGNGFYRPSVGEKLYVQESHYWLDLSTEPNSKVLRENQRKELKEIREEYQTFETIGIITNERWEGTDIQADFFFTVTDAAGVLTEFSAYEWQVPPVGTQVIVHWTDDKWVFGVQLQNSNKWWYFAGKEASWNQCP